MAKKNRIGLQFKGWEEYMAKLDRIGGTETMKEGVKRALVASKEYINPLIEEKMNKLPAKGKYSTGATKASIDKSEEIDWHALTASIKIGFDFKESGPKSIFLMYGTPRMKPVSGLKTAIYGGKTKKAVAQIQQEELDKFIAEIMEG